MHPEIPELLPRLLARQPSLNVNSLLNSVLVLLADQRLSPLERNTWLTIQLQTTENGDQASFSYEQLRPALRCLPKAEKASLETVARTLTVLRLTGWIQLIDHQRDPKTGKIMQNTYRIHAAPLSFEAACESDNGYLDLLDKAFEHASKTVCQVAQIILAEVATDPQQVARLPASLRVRLVPGNGSGSGSGSDGSGSPPRAGSNKKPPVSPSAKSARKHSPNADKKTVRSTVRINNTKYKKRTTRTRAREKPREKPAESGKIDLVLPARFEHLPPEQQCEALALLQQVPVEQQQAVLNEWAACCQNGGIRLPAAYLFGLIRKARHGKFRPWAAINATPTRQENSPPSPPPTPPAAPAYRAPEKPSQYEHKPASREVVQQHIAHIRKMLGKGPRAVGELAAEIVAQGVLSQA